jgi:chromosome condensin MukBEF ATPase and DNA-binding subunit MukB
MFAIKDYIFIGVIVALLGVVGYNKVTISSLEDAITKLETKNKDLVIDYGTCKANKATVENALLKQNSKVKQYEIDITEAQKELDMLSKLPPKVRYKTIYKTIYKEASNECEDIKSMLDSVRTYHP